MQRQVYLSFLGLGSRDPKTGSNKYQETTYELGGRPSAPTEFVQVAEMELLEGKRFDLVLIVATQKSFDAHFENLESQMCHKGIFPKHLIIDEEMEPEDQWKWFELILDHIEHGDILTVDLTHGYRSIPIIFSAAINFLQKARAVRLNAVYYGAFDKNRKLAPIIDMKDFYLINEWADAVGRLVDDADARKLAAIAEKGPGFQAGDLNDESVIHTFEDLTDTIRNVDVNNVAKKANDAIALIREKQKKASRTGKLLLGLVIDKFTLLTTETPPSGRYDRAYFEVQVEIINLLLEHKLFMQAYTVMREFIAALGMIPFEKEGMNNKKRKKRRTQHAEVFLQMVQRKESEWIFHGVKADMAERLRPFYHLLKENGILSEINLFISDLVDYRNGFDHCWTGVAGAKTDISEQGIRFISHLKKILSHLEKHQMLDY